MKTRTAEREAFLVGVLVTAIEHYGYGFPAVLEYPDVENARDTYAVIYDRYDEANDTDSWDVPDGWKPAETWRVDIDMIAHGFGVFRKHVATLETPASWVRDVLKADRTNGDDGDIDVVGALAVLESAIFGEVVYN